MRSEVVGKEIRRTKSGKCPSIFSWWEAANFSIERTDTGKPVLSLMSNVGTSNRKGEY